MTSGYNRNWTPTFIYQSQIMEAREPQEKQDQSIEQQGGAVCPAVLTPEPTLLGSQGLLR